MDAKEPMNQEIIRFFLDKNILLQSDSMQHLVCMTREQAENIYVSIQKEVEEDDFFTLDAKKIEKALAGFENKKIADDRKDIVKKQDDVQRSNVNIVFSYNEKSVKRDVSHFTQYFRQRFKALESMLSKRKEVQNRIAILRIKAKKEKEQIAAIGMVTDIQLTKNQNMMITIEDMTSSINVLINKNREELFLQAKNTVLDEVIGIEGTVSNGIIFANTIITPDIPLTKEFKKSPVEEYAAFLGDPHFGSKMFLDNEFSKLMNWLKGDAGSEEQKSIASKIKYLVIVGDIVDGVGIYPSQEEDLDITDIYAQYQAFTEELKKLPNHIQIIICPGNHDAMRISDPQPPLYEEYAKELYKMSNVHLVSSPSLINIGATEIFSGFDVLIYHGYSFPYYADNVESIRTKGGLEKAELIMELLLRKRHLAPSHTSTLYLPDVLKDPLIIDKIPDIFVTGHIHRTTAKNFNNITLLNCSCWIGQTPYQEKVGLKPQPARLPIINLKTREVRILKFGKEHYTLEDNKKR